MFAAIRINPLNGRPPRRGPAPPGVLPRGSTAHGRADCGNQLTGGSAPARSGRQSAHHDPRNVSGRVQCMERVSVGDTAAQFARSLPVPLVAFSLTSSSAACRTRPTRLIARSLRDGIPHTCEAADHCRSYEGIREGNGNALVAEGAWARRLNGCLINLVSGTTRGVQARMRRAAEEPPSSTATGPCC